MGAPVVVITELAIHTKLCGAPTKAKTTPFKTAAGQTNRRRRLKSAHAFAYESGVTGIGAR
jgi:hypothetical protein